MKLQDIEVSTEFPTCALRMGPGEDVDTPALISIIVPGPCSVFRPRQPGQAESVRRKKLDERKTRKQEM